MILEVAILDVKPGQEAAFERDFAAASAYISSIAGYLSHELQRCVEKENRYILLARWKTLEAHTEGFRKSPQYAEWKKLLHRYYDPFPTVEHYTPVYENRGWPTGSGEMSADLEQIFYARKKTKALPFALGERVTVTAGERIGQTAWIVGLDLIGGEIRYRVEYQDGSSAPRFPVELKTNEEPNR